MANGKPRILCLNDDKTALMARKLLLESHGYEVVTATHPQETPGIIQSQPIDLVVADHFLLYTEETKVAALMKQANPSLPIILFSGVVQPPENLQDVNAVVSRVGGEEGLLHAISRILSSRNAA